MNNLYSFTILVIKNFDNFICVLILSNFHVMTYDLMDASMQKAEILFAAVTALKYPL